MKTDKVIEALGNVSDEDMRGIVSLINSYDGTFQETEMDVYELDELAALFCDGFNSTLRLLEMLRDVDMTKRYFYFDVYGIESTDEIDFEMYFEEIADWLCDNAGMSSFPTEYVPEELAQAIAEATGKDVEEL